MRKTAYLRNSGRQPDEDGEAIVKSSGVGSSASKFGEAFLSIFQWEESCIKLILPQIFIYYILCALLAILYNYGLSQSAQEDFDSVATYISQFVPGLPMIMVLGFFTSTALSRWYNTANLIPGTNRIIKLFIQSVNEGVPECRSIIDQYIRYVLLFWLLDMRIVCEPLRRKFPNLLAIQIKTGLLFDNERKKLEEHERQRGGKRTAPLIVNDWLNALLKDAVQKQVLNASEYWRNIEAVQSLKKGGGNVIKFATQNTPNVLIQTVTLAVYCYGLITILGHQLSRKNGVTSILNSYFPVAQSLPFFFFYIWLKVGRIATDPFGDDDEDIDVVTLFEDHLAGAIRLRNSYGLTLNNMLHPNPSAINTVRNLISL